MKKLVKKIKKMGYEVNNSYSSNKIGVVKDNSILVELHQFKDVTTYEVFDLVFDKSELVDLLEEFGIEEYQAPEIYEE